VLTSGHAGSLLCEISVCQYVSVRIQSTHLVCRVRAQAERNNGRAAMMGITGMGIHESLTGNPVWPIPIPPQPVLDAALDDVEKGPARVGSFVLVSLGMAFAGITAAIPELTYKKSMGK
jgi:hypothetical protein